MAITASRLRQNIYRLLDQVIDTGVPLEIERNGRRLRIELEDGTGKLERIVGRGNPHAIVGDPEELVSIDWSPHWDPDRALDP